MEDGDRTRLKVMMAVHGEGKLVHGTADVLAELMALKGAAAPTQKEIQAVAAYVDAADALAVARMKLADVLAEELPRIKARLAS